MIIFAQSRFGVKGLPIEEFLDSVKDKLPHLDSLDLKYGKLALKAKIGDDEMNQGGDSKMGAENDEE